LRVNFGEKKSVNSAAEASWRIRVGGRGFICVECKVRKRDPGLLVTSRGFGTN